MEALNKHVVYLQTETYGGVSLGVGYAFAIVAWAYLDSHINNKQYLTRRSKENITGHFCLVLFIQRKSMGLYLQRVQFLTYKQLVAVYIQKHAKRGQR